MSRCTDRCLRPTPFQAHCPTCHRHFGGVTGFDKHRSNNHCLDPGAFGYVERDGIWREPMDQERVAAFRARVAGTRRRRNG
jgi:hypothetical protein